jgi:hypothetical protein
VALLALAAGLDVEPDSDHIGTTWALSRGRPAGTKGEGTDLLTDRWLGVEVEVLQRALSR